MPCLPPGRQVRHNFPHHTAKLEAVTQKSRCETHLRMFRVRADDEVLVGAVGKQRSSERHCRPICLGEVAAHGGAQDLLIPRVNLAVYMVGQRVLLEMVEAPDLEARDAEHRKPVVAPLGNVEVKDRKAPRREQLRVGGLKPALLNYQTGSKIVVASVFKKKLPSNFPL